MKISLKHSILLLIMLLSYSISYSQDIEEVMDAPIVATNGGISMSHISNFSPDSNSQLNPYSYYISGNLNTSFFGVVNVPVSFAYTNNQATGNVSQPFNRFSLSPSYKWITTHMGYSSMTFSPYTLAGHEFMGGGVELTPPDMPFKFAAMYGRLRKAVYPDTLGSDPSYRRMGGGFKIDYQNKFIDAGFNVFKAKDDESSLQFGENDTLFVKPEDNICSSISVNLKLIENLVFSVEYAVSAFNNDISRNDSVNSIIGDPFLEGNEENTVHHAYKASISQSSKFGQIGATYEKVSPNYRTLGAYYFNNDFENITANLSTSIKQRVNLSVDAGYQRDNLSNQKTNSSSRFIYSINASSSITKRLNLAASLSNLQTYVHIRDIYSQVTQTNQFQNLDTLSFTQINTTESVNANYILQSSKEQRQSINASFTFQKASEQQENVDTYTGNKIYNSSLSYQFSRVPQRINLATTVNHNYNMMPEMTLSVMTYNISIQKAFLEKLKAAIIGTYSNSSNQETTVANIYNIRFTTGYTFLKQHNVNLSMAMINNKGMQGTSTQYSINLAYSYMFNFLVNRENKKYHFNGNF